MSLPPNLDLSQRGTDLLALARKISDAGDGAPHTLFLQALITVFIVVAEHHTCCTSLAAQVCLTTAERLQRAAQVNPAGVALH